MFLQRFLLAVAGREAGLSVRGGMWIEDTDIEIRSLESASPETIGSNVKACTIMDIR